MLRYREHDLRDVHLRWKRIKIFGTESAKSSVEDLAVMALTGRYPQQRLAAVAELVSRLRNERSSHDMLNRVQAVCETRNKIETESVDGTKP